MTVTDLKIARLEREANNTNVSAEDLLEMVQHHVKTGQIGRDKGAKPVAAVVCIVAENPDGSWTLDAYRCGLAREAEVGVIEALKQQRISVWMNG